MHLILFLIALVLAFAGVVLLLYSVPVIDVAAAALFTSGVVATVGGFVLAGLAAAVRSLSRIAERLEIQPLPVPPVAAMGREDPAPRPVRTVQAVPVAPAPKRGSLLSWFGSGSKSGSVPGDKPATAASPETATVASPPAAASSPTTATTEIDLAPLARVPEEPRVAPMPPPPPPPKPQTASLRPTLRPAPPAPPAVAPAPVATPAPAAALPAATDEPASAVYKSGIIDGMAYRLFMDGSIEAELPQGKVRFGTIDELQKYLTNRPQ
jgi:hypothetical protein